MASPASSTMQGGDRLIELVHDGLHVGLGRRIGDAQVQNVDAIDSQQRLCYDEFAYS